ncbi:DUF6114 domain-containing protein [Saccharopolyspora erythraea]|uniref:DUF6114 domain-containing protein n=1 Tax=Saccharopolyspora erythraea TaxID=1836 RepID=UPI00041A9682|nr:DUF6114 domain-containing protein [Saccharopolyspora erythraea]
MTPVVHGSDARTARKGIPDSRDSREPGRSRDAGRAREPGRFRDIGRARGTGRFRDTGRSRDSRDTGRFRKFRRGRPFWAGLFTTASGLVVLFPPYASLRFGDAMISLNTMGGISSLVIGVVLVSCGISFWARPELRVGAGVVALLLSLVAIVTSNLGSFLLGTLLGITGAALALAWSPGARRRGGDDQVGDTASAEPTGIVASGVAAVRSRSSRPAGSTDRTGA